MHSAKDTNNESLNVDVVNHNHKTDQVWSGRLYMIQRFVLGWPSTGMSTDSILGT